MRISWWLVGVCAVLSACDLYDDMSKMPTDGNTDNSFAYIDATDYAQWIYLNLENGTSLALPYDDEANVPDEWTFALHRYDCKTNGGAALETGFSSLDALQAAIGDSSYSIPKDGYVEDTPDSIAIDMSHMMDSVLIYAPSMRNNELSKWLDVDISVMPPIYTPSNRVYIICTREGVMGAVRFTGFSNPYYYDAKGYISFDYLYPIGL